MKFSDLFQIHEPPPGGLERLRARMAELPARRARRRRTLVLAGLPAAAVIAAALVLPLALAGGREADPFSRLAARSEDPSLVRFGLVEAPVAVVTVPRQARARSAVMEVSVASDEVLFYWVVRVPADGAEVPAEENGAPG